jgi:hypothetical protein
VIEEIQKPKQRFPLPLPVCEHSSVIQVRYLDSNYIKATNAGSVDAIREYAKQLLASVPHSDTSRSFDIDSGQEREAGGLTGCREAVELLSRNSKKSADDRVYLYKCRLLTFCSDSVL